jgi:hypothetical protein
MKKDRKTELLEVCYEMLKRCSESHYVLDVLSEEFFYDDTKCDGNCLMDDIGIELGK